MQTFCLNHTFKADNINTSVHRRGHRHKTKPEVPQEVTHELELKS